MSFLFIWLWFIYFNFFFTSSFILKKKLLNLNIFLDYCFIYLKIFWRFHLNILMDLFCVDVPTRFFRFELNYLFLSILKGSRILLKKYLKIFHIVYSIISLFLNANWFEREIWDLFGLFFFNHLELRRILCDYGFLGHPMRKDFPLSGFNEMRYDDLYKSVVLDKLELNQDYRIFFFGTPWYSF